MVLGRVSVIVPSISMESSFDILSILQEQGQVLLDSGGKSLKEAIEKGQESGKELIEGMKGLFDKKEE